MSAVSNSLPTVLIVDDLFGRTVEHGNERRASLCEALGLMDVTPDGDPRTAQTRLLDPIARAVFSRGQLPALGRLGDRVVNDLPGTLNLVIKGDASGAPWALVVLDLAFYQGEVTAASEQALGPGMAKGTPDDKTFGGYFGLELLAAIGKTAPTVPVVILSSVEEEQRLNKHWNESGALAFLRRVGSTTSDFRRVLNENGLLPDPSGKIIGTSTALLVALRQARQVATTSDHVLVLGERGVGKESAMRYIHDTSGRKGDPIFESLNNVPDTLIEDCLFGHRANYPFSGAKERPGVFRAADKGTLFLDEIGTISRAIQERLLRVLQEREVTPLGTEKPIKVDVRVVAGTNEDLEAYVIEQKFRTDLLDRLGWDHPLRIPPLRERPSDIPTLAEHFLKEVLKTTGATYAWRDIDAEAMDLLRAYDWPGNIRQLQQTIKKAVLFHPTNTRLSSTHLRPGLPPRSNTSITSIAPLAVNTDTPSETRNDSQLYLNAALKLGAGQLTVVVDALRAYVASAVEKTPNDKGGINLTGAYKRMLSESEQASIGKISSTQAADFFNRLERLTPKLGESLTSRPALNDAFIRARVIRNGGGASESDPDGQGPPEESNPR